MLASDNKKKGSGCQGALLELCLSEEMPSLVDDPSARVITNRAIWMASDRFQYGSTKSNNRV